MDEDEELVEGSTEPEGSSEIRDALERIAKDDPDGMIQTRAVVEAARDPESPLHKHIWTESDEDAAYERRLALARRLIARFTLVVKENRPTFVNAVIASRTPDGETVKRQGYVPVQRAVADPDIYPQILADARRGIGTYRNRLSAFEDAHTVVDALDAVIERLKEQQPDTPAEEEEAA